MAKDDKEVLDEMRKGFAGVNKRLDKIESGIRGLAQGQIQIGGILNDVTDREFEDWIKAQEEKLKEI